MHMDTDVQIVFLGMNILETQALRGCYRTCGCHGKAVLRTVVKAELLRQ